MSAFEIVFNKVNFYELLFFNIVNVTEYDSIDELAEFKPKQYHQWLNICETKYDIDCGDVNIDDKKHELVNKLYLERGIFYPEFSKIVGITVATVEPIDGNITRKFERFISDNEYDIINDFYNYLNETTNTQILCGFNIINHDIPLYLKRLLHHNQKNEWNIPDILKRYLKGKPWDGNVLDIKDLYKFNGVNVIYLNNMIDFLNLKTNVEILDYSRFNKTYWDFDGKDANKNRTILIRNQTANTVNINIQIAYIFKNL